MYIRNMSEDLEGSIRALPLSSLPFKSRKHLRLLDSTKIIPSDGPDNLPRDWRGLASLVNIPAELASNIQQYEDKTTKVLEIWQQDTNSSVTVGQLLDLLERLDRFDVYDDLFNDLKNNVSSSNHSLNVPELYKPLFRSSVRELDTGDHNAPITYDDRPGYEHQYHAFVLYANEDQEFVDELLRRMRDEEFEICTVDRLLAGHQTQYAPVARLISERCQRIILVCSPEFLSSPANTFYSNYAQAVSIESPRKIIPIMYRNCQLPVHLSFYHRLYYNSEGRALYDFWHKLTQTLELVRTPTPSRLLNPTPSPRSVAKLSKLSSDNISGLTDEKLFLPPPRHLSMTGLDTLTVIIDDDDSKSVGSSSNASEGKKKKQGRLSKMMDKFRGIKTKKAFMAANKASC